MLKIDRAVAQKGQILTPPHPPNKVAPTSKSIGQSRSTAKKVK